MQTRRVYLICAIAIGFSVAGCSREATPPQQGGKDYREMIERARKRGEGERGRQAILKAMRQFQKDLGRLPKDLPELVRLNYLEQLPPTPPNTTYFYDSTLGRVLVAPIPQNQGPPVAAQPAE